jgi:hypothetical protein
LAATASQSRTVVLCGDPAQKSAQFVRPDAALAGQPRRLVGAMRWCTIGSMTELLLVAILIALIWISILLRAWGKLIGLLLTKNSVVPIDSTEVDEVPLWSKPLMQTLLKIDQRLQSVEEVALYLRSYCWEVQDPRLKDEVLNGVESHEWQKTFRTPKADRFGLWRRERDYTQGFYRDVVDPTNEKRRGEADNGGTDGPPPA